MSAKDPTAAQLVRAVRRLYNPISEQNCSKAQSVFEGDEEYEKAIKLASCLPRDVLFQGFNQTHLEYACGLISYFMNADAEKLEKAVQRAQFELNRHLVHYALSVALTHRKDAVEKRISLPAGAFTQPEMYFDLSEVLGKIISQHGSSATTSSEQDPMIIEQTFTGTDRDNDHKVAYFREDVGLSLHHWHWHLVYPYIYTGTDATNPFLISKVVHKDRRGELFFYMHEQMLARYNLELFSNQLTRNSPLVNWREPVEHAYYPKYGFMSSSYRIGSRPRDMYLRDVNRDGNNIRICDLELYKNRLLDAIDSGEACVKNPLTKQTIHKKIGIANGINELGNSVECAPSLSWNPSYYGDEGLHNMGHMMIAYSHDPDDRYKEKASPMAYTQTAITDPIFFRWHGFINQIFQRYKSTLPEYTSDELKFNNIEITDIKIVLSKYDKKSEVEENENSYVFETFFEKDRIDISRVLNTLEIQSDTPLPKPTIHAVFTHLQHTEFTYEIKVVNKNVWKKTLVVRIFIAPRENEHGLQMSFNEQRGFFIELDKFTFLLPGKASGTIVRKSTDSSVTIPFEQAFFNYEDIDDIDKSVENMEALQKSVYCGCGWPQHLLIAKGRPGAGLLCDLFVMVTDYDKDRVLGTELPHESDVKCKACQKDAISYCGRLDSKYPDARPMGFPFDRNYLDKDKHPTPTYLEDFMKKYPNMKKVDVRIRHLEGPVRDGVTIRKNNVVESLGGSEYNS